MGSTQNALALRRQGLVSGFNPPDVPRERRVELDQPINPHKGSDNVVPLPADVATRLDAGQYAEHFGGTALATEDVRIQHEEPSLAKPLDVTSLASTSDTSPVAGTSPSTAVELADADRDARAANLAAYEAHVGRSATEDERKAFGF